MKKRRATHWYQIVDLFTIVTVLIRQVDRLASTLRGIRQLLKLALAEAF
jgi:hypothetical protein